MATMTSSANKPSQEPDLMEVSSEEGDGETEESESDESKTNGHLCKDLESILKEKNLKAPGSYAYSSLLPFAPHACLNIEGLGRIGLPLPEPDAKRVIAYASQVAYGQGQTIVDKEVRDAWEIDASRVKFENQDWLTYVQDLAVKTVCSSLRVKYDTPPKCEFYKLLICETGSHFLPHRDIQKADGMFATMIILLPSQYTGGEVHLTHGSKTQVIDFSASSLANTAVLAWYTDVLHEVKPVTSGYRLALIYDLVYTPAHMSLPMAPTYDGPCAELRRVLHKWENKSKECDCITYLLKHRYSDVDFSRGASCLKGEDDERVALVRAAADELGLFIFLANKDRASGTYDLDLARKRRCRCRFIKPDYDTSISLVKMVDLSGHVVLSPNHSIEVDKDCFLPTGTLDGESSHDSGEEDTGNDSEGSHSSGEEDTEDEETTVDYRYHRSVFVLVPLDKLPHVLMRNGGVEYMMKLFKMSLSDNAPTEKDRNMAKLIISNLSNAGKAKNSAMKVMLDYAYKWKDIEMWQYVIKCCGGDVKVQGKKGLVQAWRVFSFDQTRASVEELLHNKCLPDRLAFINAIRQAASESEDKDFNIIQEWCSSPAAVALTTYVSADVSDASLLVSLACESGIQSICQIPIDKLVPEKTFHFLTALVKDLHPKQTVVLEKTVAHCAGSSNPQSEAARMLDEFIGSCLDCAGKYWNVVMSGPRITRYHGYYQQSRWNLSYMSSEEMQTRVLDCVELCLLTRQMDTCRAFLRRLWNMLGEIVNKFNKLYTPLVPKLCKLLRKTNNDVCSAPFIDFFRLAISHYLCYVLRTKAQLVQPPKIGCGCGDCRELDRFLAGKQSKYTFSISRLKMDHLKYQIRCAREDLVTHETHDHKDPNHFVVTKSHAFRFASMWEYRLQVVNDIFTAIGTKNVEKIMGDRYVDVCKALEGRDAFCLDDTAAQAQGQQLLSTSIVNTTTSVIGGKRKREPEVIDLANSD